MYRVNVADYMMIIIFFQKKLKPLWSLLTPHNMSLYWVVLILVYSHADSLFGAKLVLGEFCNLNKLDFIGKCLLPFSSFTYMPKARHRG